MEVFEQIFAIEGLGYIVGAVCVAGMVRGFAGFGTALVFMPVASQFVPPVWALTAMVLFDVVGPLPNVPRALRDGHPKDVLRLAAGLCMGLPLGVYFLSTMAPELFRYIVSGLSLMMLILLVGGVRYRGVLTKPLIYGTGGLGGFLGGVSGLAGPPVIMLYMASTHPAKVIRANTTLFLILADMAMLVLFAIWGLLHPVAMLLGVTLFVPYTLANVLGAAMFKPERETVYRRIAYIIIAVSALSGLPIWD